MSKSIKAALATYNAVWRLVIPVLRSNKRLADGFGQRSLKDGLPPKADIWIQAASAGEAYLAREIVNALNPVRDLKDNGTARPVHVVVTTNTRQGMEIIERTISETRRNSKHVTVSGAYFPFDKPGIMEKAVSARNPKVMVLLETELWPGLLRALKKMRCPVLLVNARMSPKSLKRYLLWPSFWRSVKPDRILAVSKNDAERFARLFGEDVVSRMPNIKFDRIGGDSQPGGINPLEDMIPPDAPFIVLGSILRKEEPLVDKMIDSIHAYLPNAVIGLFPRHMHRVRRWQDTLGRMRKPYQLRSQTHRRVAPGTVVLWDVFGELSLAYESASAAFVGGSLTRRGGQNFLEALMAGVEPVIGPFWWDFSWIGEEIVAQGLVRVANKWQEAAHLLIAYANRPADRESVRQKTLAHVKDRRGGTRQVCRLIEAGLKNAKTGSQGN